MIRPLTNKSTASTGGLPSMAGGVGRPALGKAPGATAGRGLRLPGRLDGLGDVQRLARCLDQRGLAQRLVDLGQLVRDVGDVDPLLVFVAGILREAELAARA